MFGAFTRQDFVWLAGSLCQMHRVPFDAALLLQRFAPPYGIGTLIEAARSLGFRLGETGSADLSKARFPCVAFLKRAGKGGRPALLLRADGERLLYFEAGESAPRTVAMKIAGALFEPSVFLVAHDGAGGVAGRGDAADGLAGPGGFAADGAPPAAKFGFRWFGNELLRHKRVWRDVVLASLFIQLVGLAVPLCTQVIIDKVVVHRTGSTLIVIAVALVLFMLFSAAMTWLRQYLVLHTGNRVDAVLGSDVFRHLLRLSLPYFEQRPTGTLVARVHAVETVREFMAGAAVSLILDLPFLVVFLVLMFAYSWQLSLIAVGVLFLIALLSLAITPVLRARLNRQFLLGARNQAFLTEYVVGIETVKSLQMEPRLEARYDGFLADYLAAGFSTRQLSNTYNVAANALEQTMTLAILCAGALLVMRNEAFTIGMLVAFQMFASRLSQPMLRLAGFYQEFQQASIAVKRLADIMDAPAEPQALKPSRVSGGKGEVRIEDLGFRYSAELPYLYRHLDLTLQPGTLTLLGGPSGSGKSTLARLLLGFYQSTEGRILLDGVDVRHLPANELRQYFGVVPQETMLFSGTVYENLLAANPHATFGEIAEAARVAEIHDTIEKLPGGYDTVIGEHGVGLSGGQKQRIAIARAILKHPKILIFDEAASNLDRETAEAFARTVNTLRNHATILFIAHHAPEGLNVDSSVTLGQERHADIGLAGEANG